MLSTGRLPEVVHRAENMTFKEPLRLQLIEAKAFGSRGDRFQGIVSDSIYSIPVLLTGPASATLLQSISSGAPLPGTVVEATEYKLSRIDTKKTFIIFACRVLQHCPMIGNPTVYDMGHASYVNPQQRSPQTRYFPVDTPRRQITQGPSSSSAQDNFGQAFSDHGGTNRLPMTTTPMLPSSGSYAAGRPMANDDYITPLSQLNNYSARWTILARCTNKTMMKKYHNQRGEGKLFSFDLLDAEEGQMRCTAFNEAAVTFFEKVQIGKLYRIARADVSEIRNPRFKDFDTNFEMRLSMSSTVELVPDEAAGVNIPYVLYQFKPIESIVHIDSGKPVDVIGIVTSVENNRRITKRNGDEVDIRRVTIKDTSNCSIEITLWDDMAVKEGNELEELMNDDHIHIIAVSRARVGDFNIKSLSANHTTRIEIDPDITEAMTLSTWYQEGGAMQVPATSLSQSGPVRVAQRSYLSDINMNTVETTKPSFFEVLATTTYIRTNRIYYPGCPLQRNGRLCMKKVMEQSHGGWMCEACGEDVDPDWRYTMDTKLSDFTDAHFATAFSCAEGLIGIPVSELREKEQEDAKQAEAIVNCALYKTMIFTVKANIDNWQGDERLKLSILRYEPVDHIAETKSLLQEIDEYGTEPPFVQQPSRTPFPSATAQRCVPHTPAGLGFGPSGFPM